MLLKEAALYAEERPASGLKTIYFGGGTPSLLSMAQFESIWQGLEELFGIHPQVEASFEANPDSVAPADLQALQCLGFKRISIGMQSFVPEQLQAMGRLHTVECGVEAVEFAAAANFEEISLDLMYGLPGQTLEDWRYSLERAVTLPITHISTYGLKLCSGTTWGNDYEAGTLALPADDDNATLQLEALGFLESHGFPWYEVANCAKGGHACRHNLAYWHRKNYLGLGLGAASCREDVRHTNVCDLREYAKMIRQGKRPLGDRERLSPQDIQSETMMLSLRLREGLDLKQYAKRFGEDLLESRKQAIERFVQLGFVELEADSLRLTKRGIPVHNEILVALM